MTKIRISWRWYLTQMLDLHHPILFCELCWRFVSFKSSFSLFNDVLCEILFITNFLCFGISNAWFALVEELPNSWNDAPDINSLRSIDRSFVFPGIYFFLGSLYIFSLLTCISYFSMTEMLHLLHGTWILFLIQVNKFISWHACQRISRIPKLLLHLKLLQ